MLRIMFSLNSYNNRWLKLDGTTSMFLLQCFITKKVKKNTRENESAEENGLQMNEITFVWGTSFHLKLQMLLPGTFVPNKLALGIVQPQLFYLLQEPGLLTSWMIPPDNTGPIKEAEELRRMEKKLTPRWSEEKGKKQWQGNIPAITLPLFRPNPLLALGDHCSLGKEGLTLRTSSGTVEIIVNYYTQIFEVGLFRNIQGTLKSSLSVQPSPPKEDS